MGRKSKFNTEEERWEHVKAYRQEYARTHKEHKREYNRKYAAEHSDKMKEYRRQYYQKRKAFYEAQGTTIYQANKLKYVTSIRKYTDAHRDEINRKKRERYRQKTHITDPDQLATLFKNPRAAAAYRWLIQNKKQES